MLPACTCVCHSHTNFADTLGRYVCSGVIAFLTMLLGCRSSSLRWAHSKSRSRVHSLAGRFRSGNTIHSEVQAWLHCGFSRWQSTAAHVYVWYVMYVIIHCVHAIWWRVHAIWWRVHVRIAGRCGGWVRSAHFPCPRYIR